jgi:radical SAM protein with 4Fe4S-binding SPASM domain
MLLGDDFEKINKKAVSLPEDCLKCKWLSLCNGGCPLQRNQKGIYIFCEMIKTVLPQMEKTIKAFMKTQS